MSVLTSDSPRWVSAPMREARRKFRRFFPRGFSDPTYLEWERNYKWTAHAGWKETLGVAEFRALLQEGKFSEVAARAVRLESRTNLLFSFEKMALRDAVRTPAGAKRFAEGLFAFLHGGGNPIERFTPWTEVVAALPRKQTRVLTWPVTTVFGFIAQPDRHIFLKPNVTRRAAAACGFEFGYASHPSREVYSQVLGFARVLERELADLEPRDMIDLQSFIWVQGSDEYT